MVKECCQNQCTHCPWWSLSALLWTIETYFRLYSIDAFAFLFYNCQKLKIDLLVVKWTFIFTDSTSQTTPRPCKPKYADRKESSLHSSHPPSQCNSCRFCLCPTSRRWAHIWRKHECKSVPWLCLRSGSQKILLENTIGAVLHLLSHSPATFAVCGDLLP